MSHFLVTGGSGFLGAHLVLLALERGHSVTVYDLSPPKYVPQHHQVRFVQGDMRDAARLEPLVKEATYLVHLAGILGTAETVADPFPSIEVNFNSTVRLFDLLRTYNRPAVVTVNGNFEWYNTYAITKEAAGRFAIMYNREFGTRVTVLRAYNAYGEWQKDRPVRKVVPEFTRRALFGEPIEIFGTGEQRFDLVYAGDVAEAFYRAVTLDHGVYDQIIEVGSGTTTTPKELAQRIIQLTGSTSSIMHLPMRPGEPERSSLCADLKTMRPLDYIPCTDVETGLAKTVAWYRKYFDRC